MKVIVKSSHYRGGERQSCLRRLSMRLVCEESGQDVVEYGLLAGGIALVGIAVWNAIGGGIFNAYVGWDGAIQTLSACTPDPGGAGCP